MNSVGFVFELATVNFFDQLTPLEETTLEAPFREIALSQDGQHV
jgi:hypothetical protein